MEHQKTGRKKENGKTLKESHNLLKYNCLFDVLFFKRKIVMSNVKLILINFIFSLPNYNS